MELVEISCYHPLKIFYTYPRYDKEGKETFQTKIAPFTTHHLEEHNGKLWFIEQEKANEDAQRVFFRYNTIPCGKCIGCRLDYSRTWANRLMCELKYHDPGVCWFVTLTYNNENVPKHYYTVEETGEVKESLSLCKRDVQLFHKKLRRHFAEWKLRMYVAGEYGESTKRPHMHGIYFDLPLDFTKLDVWSRTSQGFTLFKCRELEEIWSNGNVIVAPVSWQTCAYVSRYVTKKLNGPQAEFYKTFNLEPEFCLMSRKPGIGKKYFEEHGYTEEIILSTEEGKRAFLSPRYFKELQKKIDPDEMALNSIERQKRMDRLLDSKKFINGLANADIMVYNQYDEQEKLQVSKILKRGGI